MAEVTANIQIGLTAKAEEAVDVLTSLFDLIDEFADLVPEWNQMELDALQDQRNQLADRASNLLEPDGD